MTPLGGPAGFRPAYLELGLDELRRRAHQALEGLACCRACPRNCQVNRLDDKWSACKTGRYAVVTSAFPHLGEEDCLRGRNGSGTIFFGHCNLRCVFCQNYDISQGLQAGPPRADPRSGRTVGTGGIPPHQLAGLMLRLQEMGCHNINFVTPEHVVPQVLEALVPAVDEGLRLPLVYNTSAYDSLESLRLLDGIVDIYMPDLKFFDPELSRRYLKAADYPEVAREALKEMHRQVGVLQVDPEGLARRGVLIRHLVMPGLTEESRTMLQWIARELDPDTYVNVMAQYRPGGTVGPGRFPELNRPLGQAEYRVAVQAALDSGLTRLDRR
ncbi:radical SAM protein [Gemmatimonadota bacterium]